MKNIDEQIKKTQDKIVQLTNKKKRLMSEQKKEERKKRTICLSQFMTRTEC